MPNVGVEKHWRDKCLSPKRQSGTNAGVGQTSEWTNAGVPNIGVDKCRNGTNVRVDKH